MDNKLDETMKFESAKDKDTYARTIILEVYEALVEKGYDPINQMIGYILSGDPTYITSHKEARNIVCKVERDELLEELLRDYLNL